MNFLKYILFFLFSLLLNRNVSAKEIVIVEYQNVFINHSDSPVQVTSEENTWLGLLYLQEKIKLVASNTETGLSCEQNFSNANPNSIDSWKKLDDLGETALKTDVDWLKRVDDWDGAGVQLSKNGDNLKLSDASGNALGEFKNGELIPETGKYANTGTPKGDVVNGYQVVDNGGQLGIKRVPDKSSYNASELTELTEHPSAHVLERHGHDVPDEALIKRANEGIAPDGSNIGNPSNPVKLPYSSKFETPDQLKLALDNTRPGTSAFNAAPTNNGAKVVIHELTGGASYGKGVPRDGNIFEASTKVRAVYREVSPGNFQLLTMFPDF